MTPYKEFISGRAKPFPAPTGHFIKVDGRFIKATKANQGQWPFYQGQWPFYQSRWPFYQGEL